MNIATTLRYVDVTEQPLWRERFYITDDFMRLAEKYKIGMCAVMTEYDIESVCKNCDGLIIPGSSMNIDPKYYGGEPDPPLIDEYALDEKLIKYFLDHKKPIFGICGGHQELNIYFGGTIRLITPENSHNETTHYINIKKDSFVYDVFQSERSKINSYHCWEIDKLAPNFSVVATSDEGVIEAVEDKELNVFAAQWHPERSFHEGDPIENDFFKNFLKLCEK